MILTTFKQLQAQIGTTLSVGLFEFMKKLFKEEVFNRFLLSSLTQSRIGQYNFFCNNFGISYDFSICKYAAVSRGRGGFEITLRYANLNGALYKNKK
jgi:hypothetical protein